MGSHIQYSEEDWVGWPPRPLFAACQPAYSNLASTVV